MPLHEQLCNSLTPHSWKSCELNPCSMGLLSPTLTGAGGALQAPPLTKRGFRFRLPLSIIVGRGGGGRGWHLAACAPVTAGAKWVRAAQWPAEGERSADAGALSHGGAVGRRDPYWPGRSSSAELAPPLSQPQVGRHAAQRRAERQPRAYQPLLGAILLGCPSNRGISFLLPMQGGKTPQRRAMQIKVWGWHENGDRQQPASWAPRSVKDKSVPLIQK